MVRPHVDARPRPAAGGDRDPAAHAPECPSRRGIAGARRRAQPAAARPRLRRAGAPRSGSVHARRRLRRPRPGRRRAVDPARAAAAAGRRRDAAAARRGALGAGQGPGHAPDRATAARATAWPALAHSVHVEVTRPRPRPRVLLPLHQRRRRQPRRPHAHGARLAPRVDELALLVRHVPEVGGGLLSRLPRDRPRGPRLRRPPRRLRLRVRDRRTAGGRANPQLPAEFAAETETLEQYRLRHALYKTDRICRPRTPPTRSWSPGTTTRSATTTAATRPTPLDAAARTPTTPTTSTCRCAATRSRTGRRCRSTAASPGATWPSSACSTPASTAPTTRAATARPRAAPPRSSRARR